MQNAAPAQNATGDAHLARAKHERFAGKVVGFVGLALVLPELILAFCSYVEGGHNSNYPGTPALNDYDLYLIFYFPVACMGAVVGLVGLGRYVVGVIRLWWLRRASGRAMDVPEPKK